MSPPTFGCFLPFTETNVSEVADSGLSADFQSGTIAGSTDPCDQKLTIDIFVPPFVFDPDANPPCGDLTISSGVADNGTSPPAMTSSISLINPDAFGCNRNIGVTMRLPSLVFDMDCAGTWPEFLDCKITSTNWVTILSKLSVEEWETLLGGVDTGVGGGGGGLVVQITNHVADRTYLVDVYGDGQDRDPTETGVEATQLQLDDTLDTIPAGTWAIATEITRNSESSPGPPPVYDGPEETVRYFQLPIWLPPGAAPAAP